MSGSETLHAEPDGYIPFKVRFFAWWEGVDPEDLLVDANDPAAAAAPASALVIDRRAGASDDETFDRRLALWRRLWGEGYHLPGGDSLTRALMRSCGLGESGKVLDLNPGPGGAARMVARDTGAYVQGLDTRKQIAAAANEAAEADHLAKKVVVETCDLTTLALPRGEYNTAVARELFYMTGDKAYLFKVLRDGLKPRGHLVIVDYVLADDGTQEVELKAWREAEPVDIYPWTKEQYRQAMSSFGFELKTFDDITKNYCDLVLQAWARLTGALDTAQIDRAFANMMLVEGELWQKRVRAMKSGKLAVMHVHALRKETSTLSEW